MFQTKITDTKASVTSYVVASNPEVLAKLMRDANTRQVSNQNASNYNSEKIPNPAGYTLPASSLNTITVDFASSKSQISSNQSSAVQTSSQLCSNQSAFIRNINEITPSAEKANCVKLVENGVDSKAIREQRISSSSSYLSSYNSSRVNNHNSDKVNKKLSS